LLYLFNLSPEHQQIWAAKELDGTYALHPDYYRASILGEWPERVPIFTAFLEELRVINKMSRCMKGLEFFRIAPSDDDRPREFGFLVRPTLKEYNNFVLLLDKLISDNINKAFFEGDILLEDEETRVDGKVVVRAKGTIRLLEEWLSKNFLTDDWQPIEQMLRVFKKIRKLRQKPAHAIDENIFDQRYVHEQRDLIREAYSGVRTLRLVLDNHPMVDGIEIQKAVEECRIWTM